MRLFSEHETRPIPRSAQGTRKQIQAVSSVFSYVAAAVRLPAKVQLHPLSLLTYTFEMISVTLGSIPSPEVDMVVFNPPRSPFVRESFRTTYSVTSYSSHVKPLRVFLTTEHVTIICFEFLSSLRNECDDWHESSLLPSWYSFQQESNQAIQFDQSYLLGSLNSGDS